MTTPKQTPVSSGELTIEEIERIEKELGIFGHDEGLTEISRDISLAGITPKAGGVR